MNKEKITWEFFWQHIYCHVTGNVKDPPLLDAHHVDVKRLYQLIHEHRLDLIFLSQLHDYALSKTAESYPFKIRCMQKRHRLQQMKKCLLDIAQWFDKQHIPFIVLKGIPLNAKLYQNKALRVSNDIDLLIKEHDLLAVHHVLLAAGFNLKFELTLEQLLSNPDLMHVIKDISYVHPAKNFRIELHWHTAEMSTMNLGPFPAQHTIKQTLTSEKSVTILDNENNFLYLCIHAAFHNWQRLQWLIDIIVFYQKIPLDWNRLIQLAQQYNAIRPLLEAKQLLLDKFTIALPPIPHKLNDIWAIKFRLRHARKLWQIHKLKPYIEVAYLCLLSPSVIGKWQYILGLLFKGNHCLQKLALQPQCSKKKLIFLNLYKKARLLIDTCLLKTKLLFVR